MKGVNIPILFLMTRRMEHEPEGSVPRSKGVSLSRPHTLEVRSLLRLRTNLEAPDGHVLHMKVCMLKDIILESSSGDE